MADNSYTLFGSKTYLTDTSSSFTNNFNFSNSFSSASTSQQGFANSLQQAGPALSVIGAIGSAFGTYFAAKSQQYQLESQAMSMKFQQDIAGINARQAEVNAQAMLYARDQQVAATTMKYGKIKGAQRAAMAANGGTIGVGSNAEIEATNELMKEIDKNTINANAVRAAENSRIQAQNYKTQAVMAGVSADNLRTSANSISPFGGAFTSLLTSATSISSSMYRDKMMDRLLARQSTN
jgi:hypothetical protein